MTRPNPFAPSARRVRPIANNREYNVNMGDLYTDWLGVPEGDRPPHHYDMLLLPLWTRDANAIEEAARKQMDRLDKYSVHPDRAKRELCQSMMNDVASARVVLSNSAQRQAYDRQLAAQLGVQPPAAAADGASDDGYALSMPTDDLESLDDVDDAPEAASAFLEKAESAYDNAKATAKAEGKDQPPKEPEPSKPPSTLIIAGVGVVLLVIIGLVAYVMLQAEDAPPPVETVTAVVPTSPPPPPPVTTVDLEFADAGALSSVRVLQGEPTQAAVVNGQLVLTIAADQAVRARIRLATAPGKLESIQTVVAGIQDGATLMIGPPDRAKLTLQHVGVGIEGRVSPGMKIGPDWPTLEGGAPLRITRRSESGMSLWQVNGNAVGESPEVANRVDELELVFQGKTGQSISIATIHTTFTN